MAGCFQSIFPKSPTQTPKTTVYNAMSREIQNSVALKIRILDCFLTGMVFLKGMTFCFFGSYFVV